MGNRIKEDAFDPSDRLIRTQRRIYDVLNRLYNDIGATGQTSVYSYDGNGNLKAAVDPLNRSTGLNYDALNRLLNSTDAGGGVTRYGYDAKDRLASVQDPINLATTYTYDGLGNLTQLSSPDTGIAAYVPDAAATSSERRTRAVSPRATPTTRSIARRWRRSPGAALRWSTTTRRRAARSPKDG